MKLKHHRDVFVMVASGREIYPFREPHEIAPHLELVDVAHHLQNIGRFAGGTRRFYCVAQHSVLCAHVAASYFQGLGPSSPLPWWEASLVMAFHDGPEYVVNDLPGPIKSVAPWCPDPEGSGETLSLDAYHLAENNVWNAFVQRFELHAYGIGMPEWLDPIDKAVLRAEMDVLMPPTRSPVPVDPRFERFLPRLRSILKAGTWPSDTGAPRFLNCVNRLLAFRKRGGVA